MIRFFEKDSERYIHMKRREKYYDTKLYTKRHQMIARCYFIISHILKVLKDTCYNLTNIIRLPAKVTTR